jgi:RNA polymerase sigma-70 factor (ECF subfamily)
MITSETRGAWKNIEERLRPYVARRLSSSSKASAADIDDVVQEVLARVHTGVSDLRDGERFGGWVYRVASNAIADLGRRSARDPLARGIAGAELDVPDGERDDRDQLIADMGQCVALFVARLASPYREAITLTELEGVPQVEAARMLGISISGMKSRVQRGRDKLRDMFDACCEISVDCRGRVVACEPRAEDC